MAIWEKIVKIESVVLNLEEAKFNDKLSDNNNENGN